MKLDMEYTKNTLYINISGIINRDGIKKLRKKMFYIIEEYNIYDIVIDIKNKLSMDADAFYNLLDEYDIKYGGNLIVVDK
ncbi:MAG: hypothetical protein GX247_00435 [Mollicutes bacterium]|nr:hypothetical protein [Mollicutes bacterium]